MARDTDYDGLLYDENGDLLANQTKDKEDGKGEGCVYFI